MCEDELLSIATTLVVAGIVNKKKRKREKWCKAWLLKRASLSHVPLMDELRAETTDWFNYLRMSESTYLELLGLVTPYIEKQDTCMRQAISPHERLSATLRFLATGRSYEDLKFSVAISAQSLGKIIPETCRAIWKALQKDFLKVG